jgi:glycosyltransferase involved in cell wall biosynthesis
MVCDSGGVHDVSVVIPHYNSVDLLWVAIESVSRQTVPPREIIVVDDASHLAIDLPDQCGNGIALRLIRAGVNRGAAWCRNRGIEAATGDLIAFLDADDQWRPDKLERCVAAFGAKPAYDDIKVLFTNVMLTDGNERVPGNRAPYAGQAMLDFILLGGGYIQTSSIMMWRHQYPLVRFDGSLRRHQDWDFAIRAEMAGCTFIYLHDALVDYSLSAAVNRLSGDGDCEPSLTFLEKYNEHMSKAHISSFVFNVLIYKRLGFGLRLGIIESMISNELKWPDKGWALLFLRLVIGTGSVNAIKQLRRKIPLRRYSA